MLVLLDDKGLGVAEGPASWDALGAFDPSATRRSFTGSSAHLADAAKAIAFALHDAAMLGKPAHEAVAAFGPPGAIAALAPPPDEDHATATKHGIEDPPPPEPASDESGGTGTAMALDEGTMGKSGPTTGPQWGSDVKPDGKDPIRAAQVVGAIAQDRTLSPQQLALVLAAPDAKAAALIDVLAAMGEGLIGVRYQSSIRALRLDIHALRTASPDRSSYSWLEVRIAPAGLELEDVPDKVVSVPWATGALDQPALAKAYAAALAQRKLDAATMVDVLVDPATRPAPGRRAGRARQHRRAHDRPRRRADRIGARAARPSQPQRGVRRAEPQRRARQEGRAQRAPGSPRRLPGLLHGGARRASRPRGHGHGHAVIAPTGKVTNAAAAGVAPDIADCVRQVLSKLEFAKGAAGTQVVYPIKLDS